MSIISRDVIFRKSGDYSVRTGAHNSPRPVRPAPALLRALDGERPDRTPVWFMRQAGRSLPEYRALRRRADAPMLDICLRPEQAAEITLQPVRRHGVDAAVLFSDIMVPLRLAGVGVRIEPGVGPVIAPPVRDAAQVAELTARRYGEGPDGAAGAGAIGRVVALAVAELGSPAAPGPGGTASASGTVSAGIKHPNGYTSVYIKGYFYRRRRNGRARKDESPFLVDH